MSKSYSRLQNLSKFLIALCIFGPICAYTHAAAGPIDPPSGKPNVSMESFGKAHPRCLEWYNICQICKRDSAGAVNCSTPGIACLPGKIVCRMGTAIQEQTPGAGPGDAKSKQ